MNKVYQIENKDRINFMKKEYISNKRKSDSLFKLKESISGLIRSSIKHRGYYKKSRTEEILGCTIEEFKSYLESLFVDSMCWENYGKVWNIDHIYPLSKVDWDNPDMVKMVCHYTNLQPLFCVENIIKSNKII